MLGDFNVKMTKKANSDWRVNLINKATGSSTRIQRNTLTI